MSGLEQIISIINTQGKTAETDILAKAEKKAEEILAEGKISADAAYEEQLKKANDICNKNIESAKSGAVALKNKAILSAKVEGIYSVINAAAERLNNLSDKEYFSVVLNLAVKHAHSGNGLILFNKKDLSRIPADFIKNLNSALKEKNAVLALDNSPAEIPNGFVLKYGDIEENCRFSALIDAKNEELKDGIAEILFG